MNDYDVLDLDERQIDLRIGEALLRDDLGVTDLADSDKIAATNTWFARTRQDIAHRICRDPLVVQYLSTDGAGERELLDALVGALGFLVGVRRLSTRMRQSGHEISEGAPPRSLGTWGD